MGILNFLKKKSPDAGPPMPNQLEPPQAPETSVLGLDQTPEPPQPPQPFTPTEEPVDLTKLAELDSPEPGVNDPVTPAMLDMPELDVGQAPEPLDNIAPQETTQAVEPEQASTEAPDLGMPDNPPESSPAPWEDPQPHVDVNIDDLQTDLPVDTPEPIPETSVFDAPGESIVPVPESEGETEEKSEALPDFAPNELKEPEATGSVFGESTPEQTSKAQTLPSYSYDNMPKPDDFIQRRSKRPLEIFVSAQDYAKLFHEIKYIDNFAKHSFKTVMKIRDITGNQNKLLEKYHTDLEFINERLAYIDGELFERD